MQPHADTSWDYTHSLHLITLWPLISDLKNNAYLWPAMNDISTDFGVDSSRSFSFMSLKNK